MKIYYALFFSFAFLNTLANDNIYCISHIPSGLIKNANVVKRMEYIDLKVKNPGEAILKKKYAITILNEKGDDYAIFEEYYDKIHSIESIEGKLFDAFGKEIKTVKTRDVSDLSGVSDNNLMDDYRRKFHQFYCKTYPYTVEYEVEMKYNGILFFPTWVPRISSNYAVQESYISITAPSSYKIRYRAFNYNSSPNISEEKNQTTMIWGVKELPAIEEEYAQPNWYEINPVIFFAPSDFEIQEYNGNMNTWQDFGKFVYTLKKGRDVLPDEIKKQVQIIKSDLTDKKEIVKNLYKYFQNNTRYVSIQLGIGGWQPFDAKFVASKAYGDCKALANYMYSLLQEAGIPSYYTLVKAGENAYPIIADFPSQQFNHVILCVPLEKDTIWLECTSKTFPAGYLGSFTADRDALLVDESDSKLIHTPQYKTEDNLQLRHITASLDSEATLKIVSITNYSGLQQEDVHSLIHSLSKDKVKEFLHHEFDFATYDINNFNYIEDLSMIPSITENIDITVSNYATITGKRLFIVPNIMNRMHHKLSVDSSRKFDLELKAKYRDLDSVEIDLPDGYVPEAMPKNVSVESKFGKYSSSIKLLGDKLFYYRKIEFNGGHFLPKDYNELVSFYDAISKADRSKIVLVKKE